MTTNRFYTVLVAIAILSILLAACGEAPKNYEMTNAEFVGCTNAHKSNDPATWFDAATSTQDFLLANNPCYQGWKAVLAGGEIVVK